MFIYAYHELEDGRLDKRDAEPRALGEEDDLAGQLTPQDMCTQY